MKILHAMVAAMVVLACAKKPNNVPPIIIDTTPPLVESWFTPDSCGTNQDETNITRDGWRKIWSDDFTKDLADWKTWIGGAYNNEYQLYQSTNLNIGQGVLKITPRRETLSGRENPSSSNTKTFDFTSARIETKVSYSADGGKDYSMIRMAARVRTSKGLGMWPAFWCYGDAWPSNGEIDIMEADGNLPKKYTTNYFYGTKANEVLTKNTTFTYTADTELTACWHVYELIWEKEQLTFLLDGKVVSQSKGGYVPNLYDKKQNIVLNLAVGGDYVGRPDKALIKLVPMYTDWVKVFVK